MQEVKSDDDHGVAAVIDVDLGVGAAYDREPAAAVYWQWFALSVTVAVVAPRRQPPEADAVQ